MTDNRPTELSLIERLYALETEKRGIAEDIKEVKKEAREAGYETAELAAIVETVKRMLETPKALDRRIEKEKAVAQLAERLGAFKDTPLGQSALAAIRE